MASYKQPCMHCGQLIESDSRLCPICGRMSPFGYLCPECLRPIQPGQQLCSGCATPLYVACPHCGQTTFVKENCDHCSGSLMIICENPRCGALQFFRNEKCTACGKKMKKKKLRSGGK